MSLKEADVDRMWRKLNFDINPRGDHVRAILRVNGKQVLMTKRSHGSGKLEGLIPDLIRKQMKLDRAQFDEAISCPLTHAGYIEILSNQGLI